MLWHKKFPTEQTNFFCVWEYKIIIPPLLVGMMCVPCLCLWPTLRVRSIGPPPISVDSTEWSWVEAVQSNNFSVLHQNSRNLQGRTMHAQHSCPENSFLQFPAPCAPGNRKTLFFSGCAHAPYAIQYKWRESTKLIHLSTRWRQWSLVESTVLWWGQLNRSTEIGRIRQNRWRPNWTHPKVRRQYIYCVVFVM